MVGTERADIRRRNRAAIKAYICYVREARHKGRSGKGGGGGWSKKRESELPLSWQGEVSLDDEDNRFATKLLNPIIEEWLRYKWPGLYFEVEEASLQHTHWEDGATVQAQALHRQFNKALSKLEGELNQRYPGVEVMVNVNPKAKRVPTKYHAAAQQRVEEAVWGNDEQDGYVVITKRLEQVEGENPHLNRKQCRQLLSNRMKAEGQPYHSTALIEKAERRVRELREQGLSLRQTG